MKSKLDQTDIKILDILQENGRITIKALADLLDLSTTPVFERVKKMEREGIISKYAALVDQKKIDKKLTVFVSVSLKNHTRSYLESFVNEMRQYSEVQECYHIAGDFDFMIKVVMHDMEDYESFLLTKLSVISNIGHVKSSFVLSRNKYSTAYNIG